MVESASETLRFVLDAVRRAGLGWIADEAEAELALGRAVERPMKEPTQRMGLGTEEYSDAERLEITLHILIERTQVANALRKETDAAVRQRLAVTAVEYFDVDAGAAFEPFAAEYLAALAELERLLPRLAVECDLRGPLAARLSTRPATVFGGGR